MGRGSYEESRGATVRRWAPGRCPQPGKPRPAPPSPPRPGLQRGAAARGAERAGSAERGPDAQVARIPVPQERAARLGPAPQPCPGACLSLLNPQRQSTTCPSPGPQLSPSSRMHTRPLQPKCPSPTPATTMAETNNECSIKCSADFGP